MSMLRCEACAEAMAPTTANGPRDGWLLRWCDVRCRKLARRENTVRCAGTCGRLLHGSPTSLPEGERMCRACRRARRGDAVSTHTKQEQAGCQGRGEAFST